MKKKCVSKMKVGVRIDLTELDDAIDNLKRAIAEFDNIKIGVTTDDELTEELNSKTPVADASWLTELVNKGSLSVNQARGEMGLSKLDYTDIDNLD